MAEGSKKLGKYELLEELGRGGFGTVYRARDLMLDVERAVKVLHPGLSSVPEFIERFRREARVAARLDHPYIVPVYEFGEDQGYYYLVMKYLPAGSLKDILAKEGALSYERALGITRQVAAALEYAFAQPEKLIHRDIKPGNILFDTNPLAGTSDTVRLGDFGFAKALGGGAASSLSASGGMIGTPAYMAPEVWRNKQFTPATDVYSLACLVYEMLTGKVLFDGESPADIMTMHVLDGPQFPDLWSDGIPAGIEAVLGKALAKESRERYQGMSVFASALDGLRVEEERKAAEEQARLETEAAAAALLEQQARDARIEQEAQARILREEQARQKREKEAEVERLKAQQLAEQARLAREKRENDERIRIKKQVEDDKDWTSWEIIALLVGGLGVVVLGIVLVVVIVGLSKSSSKPVVPASTLAAMATPTMNLNEKVIDQSTATDIPEIIQPVPNPTAIITLLSEKDGMVLVYVPAGPFTMGSDNAEDDEKPRHSVTLDAYWIGQTEVTNGMFQVFTQESGYQTEAEKAGKSYIYSSSSRSWEPTSGADWQHPQGAGSSLTGSMQHPVVHISWSDASAYCAWAGARLPTEEEWEKAARGTDGRTYPWGDALPNGKLNNFADVKLATDFANTTAYDGYEFTAPVGSYPAGASPYGVLDLAGNVWEWNENWLDAYTRNNITNPNFGTEYRVLRGGSWYGDNNSVRSAKRFGGGFLYASSDVGFRCARSLRPAPAIVSTFTSIPVSATPLPPDTQVLAVSTSTPDMRLSSSPQPTPFLIDKSSNVLNGLYTVVFTIKNIPDVCSQSVCEYIYDISRMTPDGGGGGIYWSRKNSGWIRVKDNISFEYSFDQASYKIFIQLCTDQQKSNCHSFLLTK